MSKFKVGEEVLVQNNDTHAWFIGVVRETCISAHDGLTCYRIHSHITSSYDVKYDKNGNKLHTTLYKLTPVTKELYVN